MYLGSVANRKRGCQFRRRITGMLNNNEQARVRT